MTNTASGRLNKSSNQKPARGGAGKKMARDKKWQLYPRCCEIIEFGQSVYKFEYFQTQGDANFIDGIIPRGGVYSA